MNELNLSLTALGKKSINVALNLISPENISLRLHGRTKEVVINELLDMLAIQGKLLNRDMALKDLLDRERTMSTAIPNGIAIPHAKTNAVQELTAVIGIKKSGVDFDSALDDKTRIIILALAPPNRAKPLYKFLLAITTALSDDTLRSKILTTKTPAEVAELLRQYK
ncbi:MAG: PTS sugar transporter subunit IIA [Treponema sp.]|nr:PTS sugar transporter subunit IIA [Treponema sp.]